MGGGWEWDGGAGVGGPRGEAAEYAAGDWVGATAACNGADVGPRAVLFCTFPLVEIDAHAAPVRGLGTWGQPGWPAASWLARWDIKRHWAASLWCTVGHLAIG